MIFTRFGPDLITLQVTTYSNLFNRRACYGLNVADESDSAGTRFAPRSRFLSATRASTLLRPALLQSIRSWLARPGLSLPCRRTTVSSVLTTGSSLLAYDFALPSPSVYQLVRLPPLRPIFPFGSGAGSPETSPLRDPLPYGFSPLPAFTRRVNASFPSATPLREMNPSGSGSCDSHTTAACEGFGRTNISNEKLASKLALTNHPVSLRSPIALLLRLRYRINVPGPLRSAGLCCSALPLSRRPSGLRKTTITLNSLAHRTTWLRSDFLRRSLP